MLHCTFSFTAHFYKIRQKGEYQTKQSYTLNGNKFALNITGSRFITEKVAGTGMKLFVNQYLQDEKIRKWAIPTRIRLVVVYQQAKLIRLLVITWHSKISSQSISRIKEFGLLINYLQPHSSWKLLHGNTWNLMIVVLRVTVLVSLLWLCSTKYS